MIQRAEIYQRVSRSDDDLYGNKPSCGAGGAHM